MEQRRIAVTSPMGNWSYIQLLGASVRIRSRKVSDPFGYDSEKIYLVDNIKIRINSEGKCVTSIYLVGETSPFMWKDLEIVGLDLTAYADAICGNVCSGQTLCGYTTN